MRNKRPNGIVLLVNDQSKHMIRKNIKIVLMAPVGLKCQNCGYNKCLNNLTFHHKVPAQKRFNISSEMLLHPLQDLLREASKCIVVCHNCHGEIHAGILDVSRILTLKYDQ